MSTPNPNRLSMANLWLMARDTSRVELQRQASTGMTHPRQRAVLALLSEDAPGGAELTATDARLTLRAADDVANDEDQTEGVRMHAHEFVMLRRDNPTDADRAMFAMDLQDKHTGGDRL
jgi:hypothetical protein